WRFYIVDTSIHSMALWRFYIVDTSIHIESVRKKICKPTLFCLVNVTNSSLPCFQNKMRRSKIVL
ncbi:hypothetical protein L9F63_010479, partial [Diploptera punctata]